MESYLDREIDSVLNGSFRRSPPTTGAFATAAAMDDSPIAVQRLMQDAERLSQSMRSRAQMYGRGASVDSSPAALRVTVNDLELRMSTISSTISKMLKAVSYTHLTLPTKRIV